MVNNLVIIGYKKNEFIKEVQYGPFNDLSLLLYKPNKKMKKIFSKEELKYLKPFDLYDNYEMEIEDVSGWDDNVFLKGKKKRDVFGICLQKLFESLENILEEETEFYKETLARLIKEFNDLPSEIDYVTLYDL